MCLSTSMKAEERSIMYSWPMSGEVFLSFLLNQSDDLSYLNVGTEQNHSAMVFEPLNPYAVMCRISVQTGQECC